MRVKMKVRARILGVRMRGSWLGVREVRMTVKTRLGLGY